MKVSRNKLNAYAKSQHGFFTAKQARACGYTTAMCVYHCRNKHWQWVAHGLYRLPGFNDGLEAEFTKWALWSRNEADQPQAIISHESALTAHALGEYVPGRVHLTVPKDFRKSPPPECVVHKDSLNLSAIEPRAGFMLTNLVKTLEDLQSGLIDQGRWKTVLSRAQETGRLTAREDRRL